MKKGFSFSKEHTEIIKGVAIILMLMHHFFGFPEWYVEGVSYIGIPFRGNTLEYAIGQFGHICVALFAFITGYGMYFSYRSGNILKKTVKKGVSFLLGYWLVLFLVAIPVNLLLGKTDITFSLILRNLFSYENSLVSFAWYVRFYIEILITLPLFYRMLTKSAWLTIPLFLGIPVLLNCILSRVPYYNALVGQILYFSGEYFLWITTTLMGLCFARYKLFEKMGKLFSGLKKLEYPICFVLMLVLIYLRTYKANTIGGIFSFDCIYAPIFIFLTAKIMGLIPDVGKFFKFMGLYSMNIWFLHSIFFFRTSALMKYAYAPKLSVFIILWVVVLCIPVAWLLTRILDFVLGKKKTVGKTHMMEQETQLSQ